MVASKGIRKHGFAAAVATLALVVAGAVVLVSALRGDPAEARS